MNGVKGDTGNTGEQGVTGNDGAIPVIGVQDEGGVYYWTIDGDWLKDSAGQKISATGNNGADGNTPTVAIGSDGYWYICPDGACNGTPPGDGWEDTHEKAVGDDGQPGNNGDTPKVIIGTDNYWYICPTGVCTGTPPADADWTPTGVKAKGEDGSDGITPELRINETTGEWDVCLSGNCDPDDGDWTSTGKIAAPQIGAAEYPDHSGIYYWTVNGDWLKDSSGNKIPVTDEKGDPGNDGSDGKTPKVAIGSDGNWYICPNGSCTNTPPAAGWEDTHVKATGNDGAKGEQGDAIFAKNGIDNSHDGYVEFTLAGGGTLQVPKYVPLSITFTPPPTPFNNSELKNIPLTLVGYVRSIVAVDVPRGWTIAFDLTAGGEKIKVTAPAANNGYYTAAGTATLLVSDGNTQTITAPLALACNTPYTPPAAPDIVFEPPTPFNNSQTKTITLTTVTATVKTILAVDVPLGETVTPDVGQGC
jgi:hypothetical protein